MKHTPGPWFIEERDGYEWAISSNTVSPHTGYSAWNQLAVVYGCEEKDGEKANEEGYNNARLIAAAPEMRNILLEIAAKARLEQEHPTGLHMTCLSLIQKLAECVVAKTEIGDNE